jgi:tRNA(fMet)-specific endonuclease VapC
MKYLLDTNICSEYLRGRTPVTTRILQHAPEIAVSTISAGELYVWAYRVKSGSRWRQAVHQLLQNVPVLDVDLKVAEQFGRVHASLLDGGRPIPGLDLLIAATAIVHDLTLVTHNTRDFADLPGVRLEDWQA